MRRKEAQAQQPAITQLRLGRDWNHNLVVVFSLSLFTTLACLETEAWSRESIKLTHRGLQFLHLVSFSNAGGLGGANPLHLLLSKSVLRD